MIDQKTKDHILKDLYRILDNVELDIMDKQYLYNRAKELIEYISDMPVITEIEVEDFERMRRGTSEKMIKGLFWI